MARNTSKKLVTKAATNKATAKARGAKARTGKATAPRVQLPAKGNITILVKGNPYRDGSKKAKCFAKLRAGMQMAAAITAGVTRGDLARMVRYGRIAVK